MKRKLVNRKVVNSISIGIMAFITAATPVMSVAAEEGDGAATTQGNETTVQSGESGTEQKVETKSEQSTAVGSAQDAINTAQKEAEGKDELKGVEEALNKANEALEKIETAVDALDQANAAVDSANEAIGETLEDPDNILDINSKIDIVTGAADSVIEAIDKLTDDNVNDVKDNADAAEGASQKTYENEEAAKEAETKVKEDADSANAEDGLLGTVEKAEKEFQTDNVNDALGLLKDQIEKIEEAQEKAEEAAVGNSDKGIDGAQQKLENIQSDTDGAETLDVTKVTETQTTLQDTLEEVKSLQDQIRAGLGKDAGEEVNGLIKKLAEINNLNKYELNSYLASIVEKCTDVTVDIAKEDGTTENVSVALLLSDYVNKYNDALKDHVEALDKLSEDIDGLQLKDDSETKKALENAKEAFEQAKAYEEGCLEACGEIKDVMTAISDVQKAQEDLDKKKNETYESLFGNVKGYQDAAQKAYGDYEAAQEEVKKLEDKYLIDSGVLHDDLEQAREARDKAWKDYIDNQNLNAEERIKYLLLKEGTVKTEDIENIKFSEWVSDAKEDDYANNGVKVTYNKYDENGNVIGKQEEYFDFVCPEGKDELTIVKKNPVYKANDGAPSLIVQVDKGEAVYKLGDEVIDSGRIKYDSEGNYQIDGVAETTNTYTVKAAALTYTVKATTRYDGEIVCECVGPAGGKFDCKAEIKDGSIVGFRFLSSVHSVGEPNSTETKLLAFKHDGTFDGGKGDENRGLLNDIYQKDKENYSTAVGKCEEALKLAEESLESKVSGRADDDAVKTAVGNFLDTEKKGTLEEVSNAASAADQTASDNWRAANTVKSKVSDAYVSIGNVIKSLFGATAKTADKADHSNITEAIEKHEKASELLENDSKLGLLKDAVERLNGVVQKFPFGYNTPSTGGDGGTTGGGTTGGGGTGGTGGGTTTPTNPTTPVVTVPEEAVPLAGAGTETPATVRRTASASTATADGAETGGGAGTGVADGDERTGGELQTLEDEETPLASLEEEKETGTAVVEDEETPLAAPIEEQSKMSWWWLLLIALLGVTGEEMYRRHRKKMAEAEEMRP